MNSSVAIYFISYSCNIWEFGPNCQLFDIVVACLPVASCECLRSVKQEVLVGF